MFVIYHKETTKYLHIKGRTWHPEFQTLAAAKAALTREVKKGNAKREEYDIMPAKEFHDLIEKTEVRHGAGPAYGKDFTVPVNTPWTTGPWSETYWCS